MADRSHVLIPVPVRVVQTVREIVDVYERRFKGTVVLHVGHGVAQRTERIPARPRGQRSG